MVGVFIVLGIIANLLAAFDVASGAVFWHALCALSLVGAMVKYGREQNELMRIVAAQTQLARDIQRNLDMIRETSESIQAAQKEPSGGDSS